MGVREELEAAADAQGRSFAGTAREWGDADVDALCDALGSEPLFEMSRCGEKFYAAFGASSTEEPMRATARRMLHATSGDADAAIRYCRFLAAKREVLGSSLVLDSFSRGASAALWAAGGFLFRAPIFTHVTCGTRPLLLFAPVELDPAAVLAVPEQHMLCCLVRALETCLMVERERGEAGHLVVFDLAEFSWRHLQRAFIVRIVCMIAIILRHYPELIHR